MAGYPDFQRLAVTLPAKSEAVISWTMPSVASPSNVASPSYADVIVYAPAQCIATVMSAYASIGQTSGTGGLVGGYWYFPNASGSLTYATCAYNNAPMVYNNGCWQSANGTAGLTAYPASNQWYWVAGGATFDSGSGIGWETINDTTGGTVEASQQKIVVKCLVEDLP